MIETKILSDAPGIQNQGLIDKTEGTSRPAMTNAVIVGRFKRGRMDKPFKVTANNYKALLGHDPSNPSYLAVEDVFKAGVSQIGVRRVGSSAGKSGDTVTCTPSQAVLNGVWNVGSGFNFRHLTVGKNGGAPQTFNVAAMTADEQSLFVEQNLYLAADGKSFAFFDSSITDMPPIFEADSITLAVSGIDTSGNATFFDSTYSFADREFTARYDRFVVSKIEAEQNTIEIHPTPDVIPSEDAYQYYKTTETNGTPIVMYSCAKAVVLPFSNSVTVNNADGSFNSPTSYFSVEVNGVMYNADKSQDVTALNAPDLYAQVSMYRSSDGSINFSAAGREDLMVRLSPSAAQKDYSNVYLSGHGDIEIDGTFVFMLAAPA